jgi:SAM-dependent methyltransferase
MSTMPKTLIITPPRLSASEAAERIRAVINPELGEIHYMANAPRHLSVDDAHSPDQAAHIYSPICDGVSPIVLLRGFPALYDTQFSIAWLVMLAASLEEGGSLWIEEGVLDAHARVTTAAVREVLEDLDIQEGGWLRIQNDDSARLCRIAAGLPTIYPAMHGKAADFREEHLLAFGQRDDDETAVIRADHMYIYGLFGANQKGWIVDRILSAEGIESVRMLDLGGGYGFLAAEEARRGGMVHVVDLDPAHVNYIGPWVTRTTGTEESVSFELGDFGVVHEHQNQYNVVSFFGSLLYAPRSSVPALLQSCMERLEPGGVLLVHENPFETGKPGQKDYEIRFRAQELHELLTACGELTYWSMFSGDPIDLERASSSLMMASVRKSG